MKHSIKKLLIFCMTVCLFVCLFSVVASADEVIGEITYNLNNNGTARVTNANKTLAIETVIIPEKVIGSSGKEYTVTTINEGAFRDNTNIKYLSLPSTITSIGGGAFYGCKSLIFVDFNDNQNEISMSSWGVFRGCTSLKAISFPDNVKTVGDQAFTGCSALTAVYLPKNLEHIKGNKWANDGPAFGHSPYLYFVSEKFEVRDENGNFYTPETFKMPVRPEIYYFPSNLKTVTGPHNVSSSFTMDENGMTANNGMEDCAFYNLPNINPILVFPESYQGYDDRVIKSNNAQLTDHKGDTIQNGLFQKCGTKEKPLTVIFLGEINRVSMGRKGEMQYTTYVFANPANTGFENTKIGTWYNTSDTNYTDQNEMYAVFCHGNNGEGTKYKISFAGATDNLTYPVLQSEEIKDVNVHMVNTNANEIVSNPDCVTNMLINTYCFCGKSIEKNAEVKGTYLGHEFDLTKGASKHSIVYENYLKSGVLNVKCARCDDKNEIGVNPIFSSFKGFSVKINSNKITIGYTFDYDALEEYERVNECQLEIGFVFAIKNVLGENSPLNSDATVFNTSVVKVTVDANTSSGFDFIISGDWDREVSVNGENVLLKDLEIFLCGYVYDGKVSYLSDSTITYSQI